MREAAADIYTALPVFTNVVVALRLVQSLSVVFAGVVRCHISWALYSCAGMRTYKISASVTLTKHKRVLGGGALGAPP